MDGLTERFKNDRRNILMVIGDDEYKTEVTLPAFAKAELEPRGFQVRVVHADANDKDQFPGLAEAGFLTSLRHERLLRESVDALARARVAVEEHIPHEMLLLDLYAALTPIDAVTGATTADDILNRIFATFCIGK